MRDCRINTIFEGSSEIMRLFIAREALDPHLKLGAEAVNSTLPMKRRARAAMRATGFYATWYPKLWMPRGAGPVADRLHPNLRSDLDEIVGWSHRLAKALFHAMAANGPKLEKRQTLLGHLVDIGSDLFVWACAISYAESKITDASLSSSDVDKMLRKVLYFGDLTRARLRSHFAQLNNGLDRKAFRVSRDLVA
jgi:hypothetical protein